MSERLATIRIVKRLDSIPNADRIELAFVDGWQTVVPKGKLYPWDKVVFIEVDSIVPELKPFSFLGSDRRIKTHVFKNTLSQGLAIPVADLAEDLANAGIRDIQEGLDVTDALGVTKYIKQIPSELAGEVKGPFPTLLVPKTDEVRIQNCLPILNELEGVPLYATLKCDGTSATYIFNEGKFHVCGRNWEYLEPKAGKKSIYWDMAEKYDLNNRYEKMFGLGFKTPGAIQGEIVGPGIQGNPMKLAEPKLLIFNVWQIALQKYLGLQGMKDFTTLMGLEMVPLLSQGQPMDTSLTLTQLLELVSEIDYPNGGPAEGLVFRPTQEMYSKTLRGRMSFKVVSNRYLLEHGE